MSDSNSIPKPRGSRFKDLTGQVFSRWTVLGEAERMGKHRAWLCRCECGSEKAVDAASLKCGASKSCGCLRAEVSRENATTHGGVGTPEYAVWEQMWKRCTSPTGPDYARYKDRVPDPVFKNFGMFLLEVGYRPSPEHSLDRRDNTLGYVPGNLRWVTRDVQANNTSANIPIKCVRTGAVRNLKPACRDIGLPYHRVYQRLFRLGWTVMEATEGAYTDV